MSLYLGIDYGKVHIGLALSDGALSSPLSPLQNTASFLKHLIAIIEHHQVTTIVVGLPEGPLEKEVRQFASLLEENTSAKVVLHEETLTTVEVLASLRQAGASRQKLRNEHSYSACLILDDYLDMLN